MSWQFEFERPCGSRVMRSYFLGISHFDNTKRWFDSVQRKWVDEPTGYCSNFAPCRSFKAFKRHLRKHPELQEVGEVILTSRFIGYNIVAMWR